MCTFAELFNGTGYDNLKKKNGESMVSPYVFSGTNVYKKGKFVEVKNRNGEYVPKYDKNLVDKQVGVLRLLDAIL